MTIGSLFAGIGGLELGLERAGLGPTVWQVETDPFCREVLAKHWPDADRSVTDVRDANAGTLPWVDIICGGFPCQDISYAGKGAGLDGERSGLWFEHLRIVRDLRPRIVVVENVAALLRRGIDVVLGSLAESGYDAVWTSLRASDVGAPHRRERVFVVAYRVGDGLQDNEQAGPTPRAVGGCDVAHARCWDGRGFTDAPLRDDCNGDQTRRDEGAGGSRERSQDVAHPRRSGIERRGEPGPVADPARRDASQGDQRQRVRDTAGDCCEALAYPDNAGLGGQRIGGLLDGEREARWHDAHGCDGETGLGDAAQQHGAEHGPSALEHRWAGEDGNGQAQPRMGGATHGLPRRLDGRWPAGPHEAQHRWEAPRTTEGCPNRAARLKSLGNAVVPQCAEVVGWIIQAMENAS